MINNNLKWGVVIVAYNPEIRVFKKKIDAISKLTDGVVVINNGSKLSFDNDRIELVNLDSNKGIAYAQNLG
ncbi:MAG: glycosyltransferase, partial [Latilactobacillus curvatus]